MRALRYGLIVIAVLSVGVHVSPAAARSVGQVIDDTVVTTEVKAKLTADKLSNLTKVEVKTDNGVVTLNGVVDTPERRARAEQITGAVNGVRAIVNNIHVAGSTIPPAPTSSVPPPVATVPAPIVGVDATGVVSHVDAATGTVTLQDGRVLRLTNQTAVWQPSTIQSLRPGTQVYLRAATPVAVQPTATAPQPEWRMGTVRSVDRASAVVVLTDGTAVRIGPNAVVRRGNDRLMLEQLVPGTEVVVRRMPSAYGAAAEGSAFPGTVQTIDASEVNVVWTPVGR